MVKYHYFKRDNFHSSRAGRIGASDVPAILPNPEKPTESLAGWGRTALTVYKEKWGELEGPEYNLPMEMGHYLENKSAELFIRRFWNADDALSFRARKEQFESRPDAHAINYQSPPWHHSTEYHYDGMVVHPDVVYDPSCYSCDGETWEHANSLKKRIEGVTVDLSRPFLIECKSARLMATKRQPDTFTKGYDFSLTGWQGIPLKHYVQIQFQLALMQVDTAYLSLIYDTSNFQCWKVDANRKWQGRIMDVVGRMVEHIKRGTPPKELAMNSADIQAIYPRLDRDYCMVIGDESDRIKKTCLAYSHASDQEKKWKEAKKDAQDALSVNLKNYHELRSGTDVLAEWSQRKGREKLSDSVASIKKNDPVVYRYLVKKGYIVPGNDYRFVSVKYKGD